MKKTSLIISTDPVDGDHPDGDPDDVAGAHPPVELRELTVGAAQHGERLDKCLVEAIPEFSRSYLQQLILGGAVEVNAAVLVKPSTRLKAGDRARVALRATQQSRAFIPQVIPLRIVFEDQHLMVIDKPAGLVVHPAPGNWTGTLLNGLLAHYPGFADLPRAGIVHRLDKDTSGLMVVARSRAAMDTLVRMIAARDVQRQYLALAHRPWVGPPIRDVASPIGRDPKNRLRMAVVDLARHAGKPARTNMEMLDSGEWGCLVRCTLHTGRTHQIRVHLASIGHPLLADQTYGGSIAAGMQRQALHAFRLALAHPASGEMLDFQSPPPPDMLDAACHWGFPITA